MAALTAKSRDNKPKLNTSLTTKVALQSTLTTKAPKVNLVLKPAFEVRGNRY